MKSKISKEKQLTIIELVRADLVNKPDCNGLCSRFQNVMRNELNEDVNFAEIKEWFPLFVQKNAIKYANGGPDRHCWWWDVGLEIKFDYENRILFLDWMSSKIKTSSAIADLWKKIIKYINNPVVIIKYPIN